jgi:PAS domain S-box-containing protein
VLLFVAVLGAGLFSVQATRRRRESAEHLARVQAEVTARRAVEEQLEFLIDSSPAAIVTMDQAGTILLANPAAHRLFGRTAGSLTGESINRYVPALTRVTSVEQTRKFRTEMQCRGEKENGEIFLANVFFSTYETTTGPRLAALVVDASEELRDREETGLQQLLAGSRILAGAVSHEIRNVCGAIAVIYENLARGEILRGSKDFDALGALVEALNKIASLELRQSTKYLEAGVVEMRELLDDLRIVLESIAHEADIALEWSVPDDLPPVIADRHSLLQVLLNLIKNSERALINAPVRSISVAIAVFDTGVSIRITDTGPGIRSLEKLFQPFQTGADSTGLGLYLSRAFVRAFRGDLRHDSEVPGCSFVIDLQRADRHETPGADFEEPGAQGSLPNGHDWKDHGAHPAPVG